jgi:hypothetical protein
MDDFIVKVKPEFLGQKAEDATSTSSTLVNEAEVAHKVVSTSTAPGSDPANIQQESGRNKKRPRDNRVQQEDRLCSFVRASTDSTMKCPYGETCPYVHDPIEFLAKKDPDIATECTQFRDFGWCHSGIACRFCSNSLIYFLIEWIYSTQLTHTNSLTHSLILCVSITNDLL